MKKSIALTCMVLAVAASGFSQKKMVGKAKNALIAPIDLVEAKTSIDAAMGNEETSGDPYTYVIAGKVYKTIYNEEVKKKMLNQPYDDENQERELHAEHAVEDAGHLKSSEDTSAEQQLNPLHKKPSG